MKKILLLLLVAVFSICTFACMPTGQSESQSESESVSVSVSESESESVSVSESVSESQTESVSESVTVEYSVTFKQDGCDDIVITVAEGGAVADIPNPVAVKGHTVVWDKSADDLAVITADVTVTAIATPNTYTITYVVEQAGYVAPDAMDVVFGADYTLAVLADTDVEFSHWVNQETGEKFESGTYSLDESVTLLAVFVPATEKPF